MRSRSRVWDVMEKVSDTEALCLLCNKYFGIHSNSTSNLLKHIQRMHGSDDPEQALVIAAKKRESGGPPPKRARKSEPPQDTDKSSSEINPPSDSEAIDEGGDQLDSTLGPYIEVPSHSSLLTPEAANTQLKHLRTWDYMKRVSSSESMCKLCDKMIKYTPCHGTSNMVRHIRRHFTIRNRPGRRPKNTTSTPLPFSLKVDDMSVVKVKGVEVKQTPIQHLFRPKPGTDKKATLDKLVLSMLVQDLQSFSTLKDPGFVRLLKGMDSNYCIPSKNYIMNTLLPRVCEETRDKIFKELGCASSVSIGAEVWTHKGLQTLLSVSCHFISSRWEFRSVMLDSICLEEEYSSNTIANELYKVFESWDITSKVFCITTDPSADMAAAVAQLHINHQVCYAHTLNIVMQEALTNVEGFSFLKEKVLNVVKYFLSNLSARDTLETLQKDDGNSAKNLKLEVENRWTSIFYMFQRYIDLHDYVTKALNLLNKPTLLICDEDLETMKECVQAIEPFEIVSKDLSANSFSSLSKVLPTTRTLTKYLGNLSSPLATELLAQLTQCFPQLEANMFPLAATYLDPRFRELSFEEPDTCTRVQEELRSMMDKESFQAGLGEEELTKPVSTASLALWSDFDQRVQSSRASAKVKPPTLTDLEFGRYDCEALILRQFNPLPWWNSKEKVYPALCLLARQFLSVPATCIAPFRLFTKEGQRVASKRNGIPVSSVGQILFLHQNNSGAQQHFV